MKQKPKPKPDWDAHERAHVARRRADYLELTPGERIEHGASLSRQATELAVAARRSTRAEKNA